MGAALCCKTPVMENNHKQTTDSTVAVMFRRIDKENKGYIDLKNLQDLMKDDFKAYFQGRGADHIMEKYGQDGKLTLENFDLWWNSTYTTYNNDDGLSRLVDEALEDESEHNVPALGRPPSNANVAVSRS